MPEYIRLVGDTVQAVTETVRRTVSLKDFVNNLLKDVPTVSPILPPSCSGGGCRLYKRVQNKLTLVIEEAPQTRKVEWKGIRQHYSLETRMLVTTGPSTFHLPLPYVVFIVRLQTSSMPGDPSNLLKCGVYFRKAPLSSLEDELFYPTLPNVYFETRCEICTGNMRVAGATDHDKALQFTQKFWESGFNLDLADHWYEIHNREPRFREPETWEEAGKNDPSFALTAPYRFACKLKEVI